MIKLKDILFERSENDTKDTGGVLYRNGDTILLCLGSSSGNWNIPKGHIQIGEKPLEGSLREFTEETQIILNGTPELVKIHKKDNGGKFYLYMLKGEKKFVPHLNHEHSDWDYFHMNNLPVPMDSYVEETIEKLND